MQIQCTLTNGIFKCSIADGNLKIGDGIWIFLNSLKFLIYKFQKLISFDICKFWKIHLFCNSKIPKKPFDLEFKSFRKFIWFEIKEFSKKMILFGIGKFWKIL